MKNTIKRYNKKTPQKKGDNININDEIMKQHKILLVTCGQCGGILSINWLEKDIGKDEYICPYCGHTDDPCMFPDLFY